MDRALKFGPPAELRFRLLILTAARRFDEAIALAEGAKPADVVLPPGPLYAVSQFELLQRERQRLLWAARDANRQDVGNRAAEILLWSALAQDRPENRLMDSGVPAALKWFVSQPDTARAANWVERLDVAVRPGKPGWNYRDAVAVYRAWLALGHEDRAQALYEAVAVEASKPRRSDAAADAKRVARTKMLIATGHAEEVLKEALREARPDSDEGPAGAQRVQAAMAAVSGRWDEAIALGAKPNAVYLDDLNSGVAATTLDDRLAHAGSDRIRILEACATLPDSRPFFPMDVSQADPLPLDVAARCVRELARLGRLADEPPSDIPATASWSVQPNPALVVAARASQADRPELSHEMLALLVPFWSDPAVAHEHLDTWSMALLIDIATTDLHVRGKL